MSRIMDDPYSDPAKADEVARDFQKLQARQVECGQITQQTARELMTACESVRKKLRSRFGAYLADVEYSELEAALAHARTDLAREPECHEFTEETAQRILKKAREYIGRDNEVDDEHE